MLIKQSCILISESHVFEFQNLLASHSYSCYPLIKFLIRLDINYFYVVHESGKGLMSYARGRPTKERNSSTTNGFDFECTLEMSNKISELRTDHNMHEGTKMLLFISIATDDMVKYVCMYPEVWFLDCTYGELTHHVSIILTYF